MIRMVYIFLQDIYKSLLEKYIKLENSADKINKIVVFQVLRYTWFVPLNWSSTTHNKLVW